MKIKKLRFATFVVRNYMKSVYCPSVSGLILNFVRLALSTIYANSLTCLLLFTTITLAACGGGGSGGSSNTDDDPDPQGEVQGIAIPGLAGEINIRFPDLAIDSKGVQHAVAVDIDGVAFYARCDASCELEESWGSVVIADLDFAPLSTDEVVPKIQLTSDDQPRVVLFRRNNVLSSLPSGYYECNVDGCLSSSQWQGQDIFAAISMTAYDFYRSRAFTLTTDNKPRISWLGTSEPLSFEDDALFYISCETNCATTGSWTREIAEVFNLSSATAADIVTDGTGTQHLAFLEQIIGSDIVDVTYMACSALCDTAAPLWESPVVLATIEQELLELVSLRLFLAPGGLPVIAIYDPLPTAQTSLTLLSCINDCSNEADWEQTTPLSLESFGEDIVRFGNGLDAATIDGKLTLQFTAKRRTEPLDSLLYQAICSNNCASQANWSLTKIVDVGGVDLGPADGCQFIGVEIGAPTAITVQASSYETVPYWYCGDFEFIEIDDAGNRELITSPDIRFFEVATVTQLTTP